MFYHTITVAPTSSVKYQTTDRIKQRKVRTNTKTDEMTIKSRTLPLSYPSPPLRSKPCKAPLTSTFMVSPSKMMMYSKVQERVHTISPITPEMCGIAWDQHHHLPELRGWCSLCPGRPVVSSRCPVVTVPCVSATSSHEPG